jgi:putative oxidoreductase
LNRFDSLQPISLLVLRAVMGLIFFTHGYPKLVNATPAMRDFFVQHGLPGTFLYVAGVLEVFGGILLVLGLFARPAALLLAIEMGVAIWKVHSLKGFFAIREYEYPLVLCAACLALASVGAGMLSLDQFLFGGESRSARQNKN